MKNVDLIEIVQSMALLASKIGAERTQKVFDCLTDLKTTLDKYDEDTRNEALRFVFELSQP